MRVRHNVAADSATVFVPFVAERLHVTKRTLCCNVGTLSRGIVVTSHGGLGSTGKVCLNSANSNGDFTTGHRLLGIFLAVPRSQVVIISPVNRCTPLIQELNNRIVRVTPSDPRRLGPVSIRLGVTTKRDPLSVGTSFLLSLYRLIINNGRNLRPVRGAIVSHYIHLICQRRTLKLRATGAPLLRSLCRRLLHRPRPRTQHITATLRLCYANSLGLFGRPAGIGASDHIIYVILGGVNRGLEGVTVRVAGRFISRTISRGFRRNTTA